MVAGLECLRCALWLCCSWGGIALAELQVVEDKLARTPVAALQPEHKLPCFTYRHSVGGGLHIVVNVDCFHHIAIDTDEKFIHRVGFH